MCACMPSIRVLLVRWLPVVFGTNNASSNKYYATGSNNRVGTSKISTKVSARRSKDLPPTPIDKNTIMFTQSYDVDLEDETHLVPMGNLRIGYQSSSNS